MLIRLSSLSIPFLFIALSQSASPIQGSRGLKHPKTSPCFQPDFPYALPSSSYILCTLYSLLRRRRIPSCRPTAPVTNPNTRSRSQNPVRFKLNQVPFIFPFFREPQSRHRDGAIPSAFPSFVKNPFISDDAIASNKGANLNYPPVLFFIFLFNFYPSSESLRPKALAHTSKKTSPRWTRFYPTHNPGALLFIPVVPLHA